MAHRIRFLAMLFAVAGLAGPATAAAQIPDSTIPLRTIIDELNTVRAEYAENYNKKDAAALAKMYAEDAVAVTDEGKTLVGKKAITEYFTKEAPTFGHIVITSENVAGYGSSGIDVGTVTMHPQGGGEMKSRYLVVLRRKMGVWHIVRSAVVPIATKAP